MNGGARDGSDPSLLAGSPRPPLSPLPASLTAPVADDEKSKKHSLMSLGSLFPEYALPWVAWIVSMDAVHLANGEDIEAKESWVYLGLHEAASNRAEAERIARFFSGILSLTGPQNANDFASHYTAVLKYS